MPNTDFTRHRSQRIEKRMLKMLPYIYILMSEQNPKAIRAPAPWFDNESVYAWITDLMDFEQLKSFTLVTPTSYLNLPNENDEDMPADDFNMLRMTMAQSPEFNLFGSMNVNRRTHYINLYFGNLPKLCRLRIEHSLWPEMWQGIFEHNGQVGERLVFRRQNKLPPYFVEEAHTNYYDPDVFAEEKLYTQDRNDPESVSKDEYKKGWIIGNGTLV